MYFIIFHFFLGTHAIAEALNCEIKSTSGIENYINFSESIEIKTQVDYFEKNPAEFCQRNMLLRYLKTQKNLPSNYTNLNIAELEALSNKYSEESFSNNNKWELSLVTTERNTDAVLTHTLNDIAFGNLDDAEKYLMTQQLLDKKGESVLLTPLHGYKTNELFADTIKKNQNTFKAASLVLCSEISLTKALSCQKAIKTIVTEMPPVGALGQFTNLPGWKKMLTTPKYQEGLRLAGLKIIDQLKTKNISDNANVYDDLVSSFLSSGLSNLESIDAAHETLMMISGRGATTADTLNYMFGILDDPTKKRNSSVVSISLISAAMVKLDYQKSKVGKKLYSYPKEINAKCLYAKPYHFWQSAGLAWNLKYKYNYDSESASMATYSMGKMYHIMRGLPFGNSTAVSDKLLNTDTYAPVNQVVRMDLSFQAAGAAFGSRAQNSKLINVDKAMVNLLSKTKLDSSKRSQSSILGKEYNSYKNWNSTFAPNSSYEAIHTK